MRVEATTDIAAAADRPEARWGAARMALVLMTAAAAVAGGGLIARGTGDTVDPDLARVLRFMAAMKGGFALAAFAGCLWRLARPANPLRTLVYVAAPPLMTVGALGLLALANPGLAALLLHLGLFALLAAALTDPEFLPDRLLPRRRRR